MEKMGNKIMIYNDLEKKAIERIKMASELSTFHYKKPLHMAYSGGKDSDVLLELFIRSGVDFIAENSHTSADAPETVRHIRKKFKELENRGIKCNIVLPKYKGKVATMWNLIPEKQIPPTRIARYCCSVLKEQSGKESIVATGVRWDESVKRSKRGVMESIEKSSKDKVMLMNDNDDKRVMIEKCEIKNKMVINPIIDWGNYDIWEYINQEKIEVCSLYECGFNRVGCIGCPMAGKKENLNLQYFQNTNKCI